MQKYYFELYFAKSQRRCCPYGNIKDLQATLSLGNANVPQSAIRQTLNKNSVYGRISRRKPLLSKNNTAACLKFAQDHVDKPEAYWRMFCAQMNPENNFLV